MDELEKLLEGNKKYISEGGTKKDFAAKRAETANGQQPYAIVLTCSDSRVAPEIIFDANLGEIFVVRTAGNVVDKIALGSMEYAAEHLHSPLLVVMGHEKCGAVKAAWEAEAVSSFPSPVSNETQNAEQEMLPPAGSEAHEKHEGNIVHILKKIEKAVAKTKRKGKGLEDAANENVKVQMRTILRKSPVCKKLVGEGKLRIIGAKYKLASGEVEIIA